MFFCHKPPSASSSFQSSFAPSPLSRGTATNIVHLWRTSLIRGDVADERAPRTKLRGSEEIATEGFANTNIFPLLTLNFPLSCLLPSYSTESLRCFSLLPCGGTITNINKIKPFLSNLRSGKRCFGLQWRRCLGVWFGFSREARVRFSILADIYWKNRFRWIICL